MSNRVEISYIKKAKTFKIHIEKIIILKMYLTIILRFKDQFK